MPSLTPAIWVLSTDSRYGAGAVTRWPAFFTPAQQARLERIRQASLLFDGRHREYFLDEDRSQFDFPFVRLSSGRVQRMFTTCNALKLISHKSADLLMGQEPLIRSEAVFQQGRIDALRDRTNLHSVLYTAALECSYRAESFLESCLTEGEVYLQTLPAEEVFPVGSLGPNGQYRAYDRFQMDNVGSQETPIWLLLITHSLPGTAAPIR